MTPRLGGQQVQALQLSTAITHISVAYLRFTLLPVPLNSVGIKNYDDLQHLKEK